MKKFSAGFAAHIASGATTMCACWHISRTDGVVLGFTDHDEKIVFDSVEFLPAHGMDGSKISAKLGAQVDTTEVRGILHSNAISEQDIELGRYHSAVVKSFSVNWQDVTMRELMRIDTIGEIVREDGIFRAELRSQQQAMNVPQGRRYQSLCDVLVGSARCGVDIDGATYKGSATLSNIVNRFTIEVAGLGSFSNDWFSFGTAKWTTGVRQNLTDGLQIHTLTDGIVSLTFDEPIGDWVGVGDQFNAFVGCDRRFSTCKGKFTNQSNFQGFPHIPGNDFLLAYPKSSDDFSGGILIS